MKKISLFIAPIMAISLLANCGGGSNPEPQPPEPEPTVTTYTVVLNATEGSSFDGDAKCLFLNDVPEGTLLNECKGYNLPTHEQLDFNCWYDEHGNIVPTNTPVNNNLYLISDFYHGPEFEKHCIKASIEDEWWDEINNNVWIDIFSSENDKKVFDSFLKLTYETLNNSKLSTVEAVDNFKKIYDYAKRQLYIYRGETIGTGEFVNDLILEAYQNTINDMFSLLTDSNKAGIFANLSYAYFVDSCFAITNEGAASSVYPHAYDSLKKLINELPNDDINLIQTWEYVVSKLLIVASYAAEDSTFDTSLELVKNEIKELLDNKDYTPYDVKELAKVLADYHLAVQRDSTYYDALTELVDYIFTNYFSEDLSTILFSNLYKYYLSACASDESYNVDTKKILDVNDIFKKRIGCNDFNHAERYYSIATLFAEAICNNPDEIDPVLNIVDSFDKKIESEDEAWGQTYLYYIDAFTSFAEALSEFNLFIGGIKPNYRVYEANVNLILTTIDKIKKSGKATQENFKVIIDLAHYIAKASNYLIGTYDTNYLIYVWTTNYILDPTSIPEEMMRTPPIWIGSVFLPLLFGDAIVGATIADESRRMNPNGDSQVFIRVFECFKYYSIESSGEYDSLIPIFNELISKWFLRPFCSCKDINWYDSLKCLDEEVIYYLITFIRHTKDEFFLHRLCCRPYLSALDNKSAYRGNDEKLTDPNRLSEMLSFLTSQIQHISEEKLWDDTDGINKCIIRVLLDEYIPNITEDITREKRLKLESEIASKIKTLIENY